MKDKITTNEERLISEILKESENKQDWTEAKKEWKFSRIYTANEDKNCLCGKKHIINICIIKNELNNTELEIGNCCVKEFLGIVDGVMLLAQLKKLQKDIMKPLSQTALDWLNEIELLDDSSYKYYSKIRNKKKWRDNNPDFIKNVNTHYLALLTSQNFDNTKKIKTTSEDLIEDYQNKIDDILGLRKLTRWEDEFTNSIKEFLDVKEYLSINQIKYLKIIHQKYFGDDNLEDENELELSPKNYDEKGNYILKAV